MLPILYTVSHIFFLSPLFFLLLCSLVPFNFRESDNCVCLCSCLYNLIAVTTLVKWKFGEQDSPCLPDKLTDELVAAFWQLTNWNTGKLQLFYSLLPEKFWWKTFFQFFVYLFFFFYLFFYLFIFAFISDQYLRLPTI